MRPLTHAEVPKDHREKAMELGRPLTPRSERSRASWGSMAVSVPDGGCDVGRKCVRRAGHDGACWPKGE